MSERKRVSSPWWPEVDEAEPYDGRSYGAGVSFGRDQAFQEIRDRGDVIVSGKDLRLVVSTARPPLDVNQSLAANGARNRLWRVLEDRTASSSAICECCLDCLSCSWSGREWHTHDGEDKCSVHPDALRVG